MDILNKINWLELVSEIFSGHNTTLPIVVAVGLIPNFLAWWLTKEKRRKLSVYFRRLNEQELVVAIQNASDIYIDVSSFVDDIPLLSVTNGVIEEASLIQNSESKISFTITGVYLHYLNKKSTAIFRIRLSSKSSSISSSQRQKGFRRQVPVIHEPGGNSIGWISLLEIWIQKVYFRTYTIVIPIGMPVILVPLIMAGGNWSWYFGLVLFTSVFVLTYLGYHYSRKPRMLWQMYRYYGNDTAREIIGIMKEKLKKKTANI